METIVSESIEQRKESIAFNSESRENGLDDMKFELGGEDAWDTDVWDQRGSRPKVWIDSTSTRKHRIANDLRDLNPEIKIIPKKDAFQKHAEARNQIMANIQEASVSEAINDQTFNQGLAAGFSFQRVVTQYKGPDTFEQEIRIKSLVNNMAVHIDFEHKNPAYIDLKWGHIEGQFGEKEYKQKFPNAALDNYPSDAFGDVNQSNRITTNETYKLKETPKTLLELSNSDGEIFTGFSDDSVIMEMLEREIAGERVWNIVQERKSYKKQLEWYLMNGVDIIEERKDMIGNYIPIIPYEGRSIYIKGKKYLISFIRPLKEPARLKSYAKSLEIELVALQPLNMWIAPMEGVADFMQYYTVANRNKYAVMPYKHADEDGKPLPAPMRSNYQGPSNQLAGVFQTYDKDLDDISGQMPFPQSPSQSGGGGLYPESGKALDMKENHSNHNNMDFIDNFITRTLTYQGIVINDLITQVHDEPGEVQVEKNGNKEMIQINSDEEGAIDLTEGEFEVKAVIGAANESARRESNELLIRLMEKVPAMQNVAHIIADNLDGLKDKDDVVKILKASLSPNILAALEGDEHQVFAENQQLKGQLEKLTDAYKQAEELIKSMQIDYKKAMDVQAAKSKTEIEKANISSTTTLTKTEMETQSKLLSQMLGAFQDMKKQISGLSERIPQSTTTPPGGNEATP